MYIFSNVSYIAFAVSVLVYFGIGGIWFSVLFGKSLVKLAGVKLTMEYRQNMSNILGTTFFINIIICFATAYMVHIANHDGFGAALRLGLILGIGFMAAPFAMSYMYDQRPAKLNMIDAGYHAVSIAVITLILSLWR